ncbi:MAG: zinc ABC transporter substrate-binding protein, partial [Alphaproteobacteria bacterium]|nr:zinc ABC transporter substrate-binding protein [Alphaproteobacteria bacterium]
MKIIPCIIGFAGTLFIALQAGQAIAGGPAVVASIKPVHSLVAGVMTGIGEPELLVDGTASEHDYALRPSQAKALTQADLIFWVGPQLETFLIRPLAALAPSAGQVALSTSAGVQLLPVRDADTLREAQSVTDEKSHDMHIWLDPDNAAAMVREIAAQLQARDPGNATIYAKNAAALEVRLLASKHMIKARLDAMPTPP